MNTPRYLVLAALAIGLLGLRAADGRVFWRRPAARGRAVLETAPGWMTLQSGPVQINDGRGSLDVVGCGEPLDAVAARLQAAYAGPGPLEIVRQTESLLLARAAENGRAVTLLALAPGAADTTVLFVLSQTPEEAARSARPPAAPRLAEPPPFPGSRAQAHIGTEAGRAQVEIYAAESPPAAVLAHYEQALAARAWVRVDPAGRGEGLALFQKGRELCGLLALPADGGGCTITVLHKRLNME